MSFIDDAKRLAIMPVPGPGAPDEAIAAFDGMSIMDLASVWSALQRVGMRDQTEGTWAAERYFDSLPHEQPERALDLVLAVLATEPEKAAAMVLNGKFMAALLGAHGTSLVERIEHEARDNAKLRWLLGGIYWWGPDEELKARLKTIADIDAWDADKEAQGRPEHAIDFESLGTPELARVWVEQHGKCEKDRDDNWDNLSDYEYELKNNDPDKGLDLVIEVLKIEANGPLLSYLAAGLLEDCIGTTTIDRIEREAAANERFRDLLGGVWYSSMAEPLKARLDAIVQGRHW